MGQQDITTLLAAIRAGQPHAKEQLVTHIYSELRSLAGDLMRGERPDHTLQPTALVNETLLRLLRDGALATMGNRAYLFGAAACAMRRMLVDHARQHAAAKRGGRARRHALDDTLVEFDRDTIDVLALGEALEELTRMGPRQAEVVTLRFFGGLSAEEIAVQLGISSRTVADDLRIARAWLRVRLSGEQHHDG